MSGLRLTYFAVSLALGVLIGPYTASAQLQGKSIIEPDLDTNSALVFDATVLDVGELNEDDQPQTYSFRFINNGSDAVVITKVSASCGCTTPTYSREPILPGEQSEISVRYSPKDQAGKLSRNVFVYTNSSETNPAAKLTLNGFVTPTKEQWRGYRFTIGTSLKARQNKVIFRDMPRNGVRVERIECVNIGSQPLTLWADKDMLPPYLSFRTEPEVIQPGEVANLFVTLDADKVSAQSAQTINWPLVIEGLEGDPLKRSIWVEAYFAN